MDAAEYYKNKRLENKKLILECGEDKTNKRYTAEEDEYIIQNLYKEKARDIGYALDRTELSINVRVRTLRKNGKIDFYKSEKVKEMIEKLYKKEK